MDLQTLSEKVYFGLCYGIGTSEQVTIRRDVLDIREILNHRKLRDDYVDMRSGSKREGFRLKDSDMDTMIWPNNHRVLWYFVQAMVYNKHIYALIVCDSSESPPGFTLLWLHLERAPNIVFSSCVRMNGFLYISSAKYRSNTCFRRQPDSIVHGPCISGNFEGEIDYDEARCFVSDFWPPSASLWIDRCHSWPSPQVVDDIIRGGCHFVAIGSKHGNHADNEWRISFSRAEQKLVYTMNHAQFLTYALLKLFVKEFNQESSEEEKLLCSYHMKTVMFWAIQQNTRAQWCPQNLLPNFWICFKLLLKWVYEGICPNFFIPENNMFLNKVYGAAQRNLFARLYSLYEKGNTFLLESPFINSYFYNIGCSSEVEDLPICEVRLDIELFREISGNTFLLESPFINSYFYNIGCSSEVEDLPICEVRLDIELFREIFENNSLHYVDIRCCIGNLNMAQELIRSPLTPRQIAILQKITSTVLQESAFMLHDMYRNTPKTNKNVYNADKMSCYMLKLAAKFGFVSDLLYIALYFYRTLRYKEALCVLAMTKVKLAYPGLMYMGIVDHRKYTEAVGGQSFSTKMRRAVAQNIILDNNIFYITELIPEQQSGLRNNRKLLRIPAAVLLHMLEFLCCREVQPLKAQAALDDLQKLVHYDQGWFVDKGLENISWEILGICQEIAGNYPAALYSYQQALRHLGYPEIQTATMQRIKDLHNTIRRFLVTTGLFPFAGALL